MSEGVVHGDHIVQGCLLHTKVATLPGTVKLNQKSTSTTLYIDILLNGKHFVIVKESIRNKSNINILCDVADVIIAVIISTCENPCATSHHTCHRVALKSIFQHFRVKIGVW